MHRLASQVEEFYKSGVDISSQNTFYPEEEDFLDEHINNDHGNIDCNLNTAHKRFKLFNDGYFDFSDDDDEFSEKRSKT